MQHESSSAHAPRFIRQAAITFAALLLAFAAIDDITTDNATRFPVEYTFLVLCAGWLLFVAWSLIRAGHRALGVISIFALAGALWAQRAIGPAGSVPAGLQPEHVVMIGAYFWFWALAGAMLWLGWRTMPHGGPATPPNSLGTPLSTRGSPRDRR